MQGYQSVVSIEVGLNSYCVTQVHELRVREWLVTERGAARRLIQVKT